MVGLRKGSKDTNELFCHVEEDQKSANAKAFEQAFLEYLQSQEGGSATSTSQDGMAAIPHKHLEVKHQLWDDSDNEDFDNRSVNSDDLFADKEDPSDDDNSNGEAPMDPRFMATV